MKYLIIPLVVLCAYSCTNTATQSTQEMTYPETTKKEVTDTYFGEEISDPYRWLEDDRSKETAEWVTAQNKVTDAYLAKIPFRQKIIDRLSELWNYEKTTAPFKEGDYTYFYKNDGLQNHYVLCRQKGEGEPEVFLDPNTFSKDGTTSMSAIKFSKSGKLAAYSISEGGSDWRKISIIDTETKQKVEDDLIDIKFSNIAWNGDEGFYYSSYDKPKEGSALSGVTEQHKLFYHKLGTKQAEDQLVFGGAETPRRYVQGGVTEDGQYLVISAAVSTSGNELYIQKLGGNHPIVTIVSGFDSESSILTSEGEKLYIETNLNAPNKRLVVADFNNPDPKNWKDLIAEEKEVLSASTGGGYIFAHYLKDATSQVKQFSMDGKIVREIELPGVGTANGFGTRKDEKVLYYSFSNYVYPSTTFSYDIATGESKEYYKSGVKFDPSGYESKQVFYTSKDGTKVPMIITYKKGLELNGKNPTMLYGYGGFNISLTPSFSVSRIPWLENGGVWAVASLRGGGEYGDKWHTGGTKMNKQNVFDDFIAAAEYLIAENYTTPDYLAISGRSNGGLLVGATMTQRPDLMKVALPGVGVLDMLRYHKFTAGAGWAYDYGTSDDSKEMFEYLKGYSPCHNVKTGVSYPATMVITADHDDRVVPAHSFKFAALLQAANKGSNPMLINIGVNAGHGAGRPTAMIIEDYADELAFALYNIGVDYK